MDVNDPDTCKLLRYINLPSQWTTRAGSGFDTFLIEGYQYPGINHNLDQTSRCAAYPWRELAWTKPIAVTDGLYYGTWPWLREFVNASRLGLPAIKLWAYDHVCLFAWPVPLPTSDDAPLSTDVSATIRRTDTRPRGRRGRRSSRAESPARS